MMKKAAIVLAALLALATSAWWGAHQTVAAMQQQRQTNALPVNLAYWATVLPGMGRVVDVPATQLAVNWQQLRDGAEFAETPELQQRAERFVLRMRSWLDAPALRADGSVHTQVFQAQTEALTLWTRLPWPPAQAAALARWRDALAAALQAPAASNLGTMQGFHAAQTLAMLAARQHDAAATAQWMTRALRIMPQPADIKAHSAENTARHLLPLHVMLASCAPEQPVLHTAEAQAALQQGFDVKQLRQQYMAGWDRALLLWAQQPGAPAECATVAGQYKTLLTAAQP